MIEEVRQRARAHFEEVTPAHDWHHVQRVERLADSLAREYDGVDDRVLTLAVLLHDVGRSREDRGEIDDHAEWGAKRAAELLAEYDLTADEIERVQHCIRAHRYSNDVEPETIEAKLLSDADNLDALGAVGIARCFTYGGELGAPIHDPELLPEDDSSRAGSTQFNHLHKKILDLPERMYTDAGRRAARDRRAFVETFVQRFEREVAGAD